MAQNGNSTVTGFHLTVLAIIVLGFMALLFSGWSTPDYVRARTSMTRSLLGQNGPIVAGIELFRLEIGRFPNELAELLNRPTSETANAKWNGPYANPSDLVDPWGNPIHYSYPSRKSRANYDLWSCGPDGIDGTQDDVTNW